MWQDDWKRAVAYTTGCPIESVRLNADYARSAALGDDIRNARKRGDAGVFESLCRPCGDAAGIIENREERADDYQLPQGVLGLLARAVVGMGASGHLIRGMEGRGVYGNAMLSRQEHEDLLIMSAGIDDLGVVFTVPLREAVRHPFTKMVYEGDRMLWITKPQPVLPWERTTFFHNMYSAMSNLYKAGAAPQITNITWWELGEAEEFQGAESREHRVLEMRMQWDVDGPGTRYFTDWFATDKMVSPYRQMSALTRVFGDEWCVQIKTVPSRARWSAVPVKWMTAPRGAC